MRTHTQPLDVVANQLQTYAQRGVFRSFSQTRTDGNQAEFCFYWLWNLPFYLTFDRKRKTLVFKNLLPGISKDSELNSKLKTFIQDRCSGDQPEHRRVDPKRIAVRYSNVRGHASLRFLVAEHHYEYGVKKALNLVNEIFVGFLNAHFPEYVTQHFRGHED